MKKDLIVLIYKFIWYRKVILMKRYKFVKIKGEKYARLMVLLHERVGLFHCVWFFKLMFYVNLTDVPESRIISYCFLCYLINSYWTYFSSTKFYQFTNCHKTKLGNELVFNISWNRTVLRVYYFYTIATNSAKNLS